MKGEKNASQEGFRWKNGGDEDDLGLEQDIELLHERICEFEIYLMHMDAVVGGLQKERDKMDQENMELQKENERFHQEIKFEKIHNADLKNELKRTRRKQLNVANKPEKEICEYGILGTAHPLSILKSVVQRILLFTWWSSFWFYEGLSIFGWENKWAKMERKKKRLEEENKEIEEEVNRLKKYIAEQQKDLVSQKHTNFELLNQLTECVDVNNRKIMVLEEIWKKVEDYTNILEDHFDELKKQERQQQTQLPRNSEDSIAGGSPRDGRRNTGDRGTRGDHRCSMKCLPGWSALLDFQSIFTEHNMEIVIYAACLLMFFTLALYYIMKL